MTVWRCTIKICTTQNVAWRKSENSSNLSSFLLIVWLLLWREIHSILSEDVGHSCELNSSMLCFDKFWGLIALIFWFCVFPNFAWDFYCFCSFFFFLPVIHTLFRPATHTDFISIYWFFFLKILQNTDFSTLKWAKYRSSFWNAKGLALYCPYSYRGFFCPKVLISWLFLLILWQVW